MHRLLSLPLLLLLLLLPLLAAATAVSEPLGDGADLETELGDLETELGFAPASSANQYIDLVLQSARPLIEQNGLDPLPIPNQKASFSKKIGFVRVRGSASLSRGQLSGLSSIRRVGDFYIRGSGHRVSVDGSLGVRSLRGSFRGRAKFAGIGVSVGVKISVSALDVSTRISGEVAGGGRPSLDAFSVSRLSTISVSVSGLGPLGWALGKVVSVVANSVRGQIRQAVERPLRQQLLAALARVRFPDLRRL